MLILTRGQGQTLKVGDDVSVKVLGVDGQNVRFGIAAPRSISVHRQEIYDRIQIEKQMQGRR